jgi:hypothetical protein
MKLKSSSLPAIATVLSSTLFSAAAYAEGFECEVLPGRYVGFRDHDRKETAITIEVRGDRAEGRIYLALKHGRGKATTRELYSMPIKTQTKDHFLAQRTDRAGTEDIVGEVDLKRDRALWQGSVEDDGIELKVTCKKVD